MRGFFSSRCFDELEPIGRAASVKGYTVLPGYISLLSSFMATEKEVEVLIVGGPWVNVPWTKGMSVQQALEKVWDALSDSEIFTYVLRYYGPDTGYMVSMINNTYETLPGFGLLGKPFFYWEFRLNGAIQQQGIDRTRTKPGDRITFELRRYNSEMDCEQIVQLKHGRHNYSHK